VPPPSAWLEIGRWHNAALAAAGVLVGAWWARAPLDGNVGWAALAAVAITVAANAWNDIADVDIDRVVHPDRPLPRGTLTIRQARAVAWAAAGAAIPLSVIAHPWLGAVTALVLVLAYAYSDHFKRAGLAGNVVVAVLASLPFLYGAWAVGQPARGALLVAIAAPLHFAREVAKDLDDAEGDAPHRRTIPLAGGVPIARAVVALGSAAFLAMLAWPAASSPAFALALVPAAAFALIATGSALRGRRGSPRLFKAAMVCAMLAVIAARP
jgi:geranylgeranylglycerol-phosphate geranylgeranyltransferase